MGSCVSLQDKANSETGKSRNVNRFHGNGGISGKTTTNQPAFTRVVKRPKKKVHKGLIGLPSNFQHTGHIGITDMRSGKVDPEKIRSQMAEVAAALRLEINRSMTERPESSVANPPNMIAQPPPLPSFSSQDSIPTIEQKPDPMAEIVAALRMPSDNNFGLEPNSQNNIARNETATTTTPITVV
ncbi:7717_t:CDS:2 [Ambispora leptoticha]|uniref:7717_t:CDS:1 n=1 Tax=Ambispora leptoticha TaxID=144679 RepID=A0A9N9FWK7_9GLOM|nr:7717_t:CDS:2 [Ambispora leptoticha]